jgi:hypothetical protein
MLPCMAMEASRISQPGRTGTVGALRIVKAAQRTRSSVDPIGCRSAAASSRNASSLFGSSMSRTSPPVSVGLRTIETGGSSPAQRQVSWAFARVNAPCKSPHTRVCRAVIDHDGVRNRLIRDRCKVDRHKAIRGTRVALQHLCPAVERQPHGRATETERDRRLVRFNTEHFEDQFRDRDEEHE